MLRKPIAWVFILAAVAAAGLQTFRFSSFVAKREECPGMQEGYLCRCFTSKPAALMRVVSESGAAFVIPSGGCLPFEAGVATYVRVAAALNDTAWSTPYRLVFPEDFFIPLHDPVPPPYRVIAAVFDANMTGTCSSMIKPPANPCAMIGRDIYVCSSLANDYVDGLLAAANITYAKRYSTPSISITSYDRKPDDPGSLSAPPRFLHLSTSVTNILNTTSMTVDRTGANGVSTSSVVGDASTIVTTITNSTAFNTTHVEMTIAVSVVTTSNTTTPKANGVLSISSSSDVSNPSDTVSINTTTVVTSFNTSHYLVRTIVNTTTTTVTTPPGCVATHLSVSICRHLSWAPPRPAEFYPPSAGTGSGRLARGASRWETL